MTVVIELNSEAEARLRTAAAKEGVAPEAMAAKLVTDHLPLGEGESEQDPMLALFDKWDQEDALMTDEERDEADRQWEEFKHNINAERDRAGARRVF